MHLQKPVINQNSDESLLKPLEGSSAFSQMKNFIEAIRAKGEKTEKLDSEKEATEKIVKWFEDDYCRIKQHGRPTG